MAAPRGTDGSLLSSLPWTLAALFVSVAPHVPYLPAWITAAFVGCAMWRLVVEKQRWPLLQHVTLLVEPVDRSVLLEAVVGIVFDVEVAGFGIDIQDRLIAALPGKG
jgi:hypothetical protein